MIRQVVCRASAGVSRYGDVHLNPRWNITGGTFDLLEYALALVPIRNYMYCVFVSLTSYLKPDYRYSDAWRILYSRVSLIDLIIMTFI
jgi:hypothetical protein